MRLTPLKSAGWVCLCVTALVLTGCGAGSKPTGSVAGKVTYNGNPVAGGNVNLLSTAGVGAQAAISNGAYKIEAALPAGEYAVYVSAPLPTPQPPGKPAAPAPKFEVPQKYQDAKSSGLKLTIKPGRNDLPIEIKD